MIRYRIFDRGDLHGSLRNPCSTTILSTRTLTLFRTDFSWVYERFGYLYRTYDGSFRNVHGSLTSYVPRRIPLQLVRERSFFVVGTPGCYFVGMASIRFCSALVNLSHSGRVCRSVGGVAYSRTSVSTWLTYNNPYGSSMDGIGIHWRVAPRHLRSSAVGNGAGGRSGDGHRERVEVLPWKDEEVGVVVVDHGSKLASANHMLMEFVSMFKVHSGRGVVEAAHMELAEPSIGQAIDNCVRAGCKVVVVAPLFLFRGRHVQSDIPALVAEAASQHSGVRCLIAPPLGVDSLLAELVERRVNDRLAEAELVDPRLHASAPLPDQQ
eukprot:jgi/Botrbrau1/1983/Bobra.0052s0026.1